MIETVTSLVNNYWTHGRHTYSYDALNRVASFVSTESRVYTFSYDADSRRTTVNYGTGDRLTAYDALSRVVTQVERMGGSPILTIVDAYDSAGRKISQLRDAVLTSYTYDSADRLTGQQVAGAFATFTMDAVGNITVKSQEGSSPITMTYNAGSRLVTSVEGAVVSTYTFDANGNQTAVNAGGSRTTMAYDYENRMRTAIDPGGARSTMAYWADGMRRFLEVGGTRTTFVWDGSDYLQSRTPSDVTTFSTVDAQILDSETGGSESLMVPDLLGSVVKVLNASGNEVYDAAYWPYGEIRDSVGVNDTSWGFVGTWGYHFDTSRRLYVRARVLDPVTAKWYTVDRWWIYTSNYVYVNGRPLYKIDPSGLIGQGLAGAGIGCLASGFGAGFGSWLRGETPEQQACKAAIGCVGGAIFGAIAAEWPVAAKCLGGAISGAVTSAGASLCSRRPCDPPVNAECLLVGAVVSGVLGCVVQGLGDDFQQGVLKPIMQIIQASAGSICADITRGRPGRFEPLIR